MIIKIILRIAITAAALIAVAQYVPGISVSGTYPAVIAALILGIVNVTLKPTLLLLTLPLTLLTLGLFGFVVNAALFWFVASFVDGFAISGIVPALIGAFIMSVVSWVTHKVI